MIHRSLACLSAFVAALFALGSVAWAQDPAQLAIDLASRSELVVTGRVTAIEARWDAGTIYEYVTVAVRDRLKGPELPATIVLKQLGGRVGTMGLYIDGQASFAPGEDVLLFLAARPGDGTLYTTRLADGKWRTVMDLSTGRLRAMPERAGSGSGAAPASSSLGLDLNDIRTLIAGTPAQGARVAAVPEETHHAAPAFAYLPTGGIPARWHQVDEGQTVPVVAQPPPAGIPGGQAELGNVLARWNNAGTRLRLVPGTTGAPSGCDALVFRGDRTIAIAFDNGSCGNAGGTFGIGGGYYTTGDKRTINGTEFQAFVQGFAILNSASSQLGSSGCVEDALAHTIGHAIGLGDSNSSGAIMNASLPGSCSGGPSALGADDVAGLRAIYPAVASGPNPPQPPTGFNASVTLNQVTLQWTPATTGGPAETYLIEAGSAPGLANIATLVVNAPQTSTVVGGVLPGQYYVRVRARNVRGTSLPSNEIVVTVGTCPVPSAPRAPSATVSDTLVNLTWTPPASGAPISGYTLAAGSVSGLADILVQPLPASPTAFSAAGVPYGDYYVRLFATNACGQGPASSEILVQVQPCTAPPSAPVLSFTKDGENVRLTWTLPPGGGGPSRYWIGAGNASNDYNLLLPQPLPDLTPSFSAVAPPGTYFVRVAAENACGFSGLSNEVTIVIP